MQARPISNKTLNAPTLDGQERGNVFYGERDKETEADGKRGMTVTQGDR